MKSKGSTAFWLALVVLCIDIFSKAWVHRYLPLMTLYPSYPYGGIGVFHNFLGIQFSIVHETNRGAAWGLFTSFPYALVGVRIVLVALLLIYLFFVNKHKEWIAPLALIIVGALGNIIDFFVYGHVIDLFRFVLWGYDYPVFNVADSAIFIGVVWLIILSWDEKDRTTKRT